MKEKLKVVRYSAVKELRVGHTALVFPVDHPGPGVSNTQWAQTSEVQDIRTRPDGGVEFDTFYTRYVPA